VVRDNQETKITHVDTRIKHGLPEICSDCFTLILQLRRTNEFGDQNVLKERIFSLLSKIEREAKEAGIESEDIQWTIFALVAFIDETIISSEWSGKDRWLAKPLQLEFFNRYDAGEEFFNRLEQLRQRPNYKASLLEIYYLCLALGFKGKYSFQSRDALQKVKEDTYADLVYTKGRSAQVLSPHGQRKEEIANVVAKEIPLWVIVTSAVAVGFFFYLIMTLLITGFADNVARLIRNII
jgi:type VI secretion system protein ImpK